MYRGISGVLGLGPSSFDDAYSDSFLNQAIKNDNIDAVYSLCSNSYSEGGGYLLLGGVDAELYSGEIHWFKYTSFQFYAVKVRTMTIGNVNIGNEIRVSFWYSRFRRFRS